MTCVKNSGKAALDADNLPHSVDIMWMAENQENILAGVLRGPAAGQ
jgi:hypothetical protein